MENKVVARFADGRTVKGTTWDFSPGKEAFHVIDATAPAGTPPVAVLVRDLKALFFVKDLAGSPRRDRAMQPVSSRPAAGRKVKLVFKDGEVLKGTTTGYQPGRQGFFVEPEDPSVNEERCYVVTEAIEQIVLL